MWHTIIVRAKIINIQINTCRLDILGLNICMLTKQLKSIMTEGNMDIEDLTDGDAVLVCVELNLSKMLLKVCDSEISIQIGEDA